MTKSSITIDSDRVVFRKTNHFQVSMLKNAARRFWQNHCGGAWTGNWMRTNSRNEKLSVRHHLTNVTLSANQTRLIWNILSVKQSDEGSYGCRVKWGQGDTDQGHFKYVNVTTADPFQRSVLHRVLVCAGASLCLPIILGLAHCLSSKVEPQPLPRTLSIPAAVYRDQPHPAPQPPPRCPIPQIRGTSSHKAVPKSRQKTEAKEELLPDVPFRDKGKKGTS
ncbi:hypothetical protein FQN60_004662 [Etheostoma spectabile]|uniref:Ig-like domain-containing protein n=1 Tax=Etheostoma spectabile TaxID=54343 RepID=A0A5J5DKU5_9PERO|nr:hypothetical protein FQN60_004662 [Etheostoma spectabile]